LKTYRAEIVKELRLYGGMHRFIPALLGGNGARITELPVHHYPRQYGRSKYGLSRTVRVLLDLVTVKFWLSSLANPLQCFGLLGLVIFAVGIAICLYLAGLRLFWGEALSDRPLLLLGVLLAVIGVQFLCVGILAEVQIRTYYESLKRPVYAIREILDTNGTAVREELPPDAAPMRTAGPMYGGIAPQNALLRNASDYASPEHVSGTS
jgi:hypothetical protein